MLRQRRPGGLPYRGGVWAPQPPTGQGGAVLEAVASVNTGASATLDTAVGGGVSGYIPRATPWVVSAGSIAARGGGAAGSQDSRVGPGGFAPTRGGIRPQIVLEALAIAQTAATAAFSTSIPLGALAVALTAASGSLGTGFQLGGFAAGVANSNAALTNGIRLALAAFGNTSTSAGLSSGIPLSAAGYDIASANASLGTGFQLLAFAADQTSATGALTSGIVLSAAANGIALASAMLSTSIPIGASGYGVASITAGLSSSILLVVQAAGITSASGALTTPARFTAAASGSTIIQSDLATAIPLAGLVSASANASALFSTGIAFAAVVIGDCLAIADITTGAGPVLFAADAAGITNVFADLGSAPLPVFPFEPQRFDIKAPSEWALLSFDFAPDLLDTQTLTSILSVYFVTSMGRDLNPSALANGPAWINGDKVIVPVQGGLDGREYDVQVTVSTVEPLKRLTLIGTLPIRSKS